MEHRVQLCSSQDKPMRSFSGKLKIEVRNHKISNVSVEVGLEAFYKNIVAKAKKGLKRNPHNITQGITLVIFSSFYLESRINLLYKELLVGSHLIHDYAGDFSKSLLSATERLPLMQKLCIIFDALGIDHNVIKEFKSKIKVIFELRNSLAHYKYRDRNIDFDESTFEDPDSIGAFMDSLDNFRYPLEIEYLREKLHAIQDTFGETERMISKISRKIDGLAKFSAKKHPGIERTHFTKRNNAQAKNVISTKD